MALTKISTGGVKDDAASQAIIADEAVDEARLQISNAGSNGEFLQKQSGNTGGLTWAAANQYTHPNHSGEVTSTGDGATVIASNIVDEDNLKISNAGTNGQLLSKQSGNTGGLTWTDPPASAPQIEATADGAITAGDAVIVNANGTVKKVTATYTEKTAVTGTYTTLGGGYNVYTPRVTMDTNRGQVLFFWKKQVSNNGTITIGSIGGETGANISLSDDQTVQASISDAFGIAYSKTSSLGVALYRTSGGLYVEAFTSNGTTCTFGTALQIHTSSSANYAAISWDSAADKFLVVVGDEPSDNESAAYVISHSGTTLSKGTRLEVATTVSKWGGLAYDPDNNKHLWTYRDESDTGKCGATILTVSGTSVTAGSRVVSASADADTALCSYIGGGKFVTAFNRGQEMYARVVTVSGTTPSFGAESSKIDDVDSTAYDNSMSMLYDSTLGKVVVSMVLGASNLNAKWRALTIDTSANTISAIGSQQSIGSTRLISSTFDKDRMMYIFFGMKGDQNGYYFTATTADRTSNVTTENYIGIASTTVSNGATATIDVSGAANSSQSSLTAGQKYWVKNDGDLSLTVDNPKVFAGTAVSATKLIVNDQAPQVDQGMWKLMASADLAAGESGNDYDIFTDFASHTDKKWWKLMFRLESPSGANDFSGSGLRVKVGGAWKTSSYKWQEFVGSDNNETANNYQNQSRYSFTTGDEKWHRGEVTFYDPNATDHYKIFEYTGISADHNWHSGNDMPWVERSAGGWTGGLGAIQGIRFNHYASTWGKIHFGLFASNGW